MNQIERDRMIELIRTTIEGHHNLYLDKEGDEYRGEIYADYRDEMDSKTAIEILNHKNPLEHFWDVLSEWYMDYECELKDEAINYIREELINDDGAFPDGLTDEEDVFLQEWCCEHIYFAYPEDHYLKQEFYVPIMVDTGDGNYDYTLNAHYPCWYGNEKGEPMHDKASLVWLARQQGYNKTQLRKALDNGDLAAPEGFLQSCAVEMANMSSHIQTLTFLTTMTLRDLMKLNEMLTLREEGGKCYDNSKYPYCGYITIDKDTDCGLYDPWNGGGSVLEIQLEKDVRLPIKYIRSALPDGGDGYSVDSVYGLCGSAWRGEVKDIHIPVKYRNRIA